MSESFQVARITVHDQVRDYLQAKIRDGSFEPGSSLPSERELAEQLGVSRHSLRQALTSLEAMGIVETLHGSGVYLLQSPSEAAVTRVADALYTPQRSIVDVMEARAGVEPDMARLASHRRDDAGLKELHSSIQVFDRKVASSAGNGQRMSFHQSVAHLTGNTVFEGVMRSLLTGPDTVVRLAAEDSELRRIWHDDHTNIFLAVANRNEQQAAELMRAHLEGILEVARRAVAEAGEATGFDDV